LIEEEFVPERIYTKGERRNEGLKASSVNMRKVFDEWPKRKI